jgi:hypothetical protein
MEPLEGRAVRPRQVRYQAALRPDLTSTSVSHGNFRRWRWSATNRPKSHVSSSMTVRVDDDTSMCCRLPPTTSDSHGRGCAADGDGTTFELDAPTRIEGSYASSDYTRNVRQYRRHTARRLQGRRGMGRRHFAGALPHGLWIRPARRRRESGTHRSRESRTNTAYRGTCPAFGGFRPPRTPIYPREFLGALTPHHQIQTQSLKRRRAQLH